MIIREERIGNQRLILGDCLQVMPLLGKVDAICCDPPYGIGDIMVGSGHFAGLCKKMGGDSGWDKSPPPAHLSKPVPDHSVGRQLSRSAAFARLAGVGQDKRCTDICIYRVGVVQYGF